MQGAKLQVMSYELKVFVRIKLMESRKLIAFIPPFERRGTTACGGGGFSTRILGVSLNRQIQRTKTLCFYKTEDKK